MGAGARERESFLSKSEGAAAAGPPLPLTEGLTAEEAEGARNARLAGSAGASPADEFAEAPAASAAAPGVTEGQTAEEAEASRNARLDAAEATAKSLKAKSISKSGTVGGIRNEMMGEEKGAVSSDANPKRARRRELGQKARRPSSSAARRDRRSTLR